MKDYNSYTPHLDVTDSGNIPCHYQVPPSQLCDTTPGAASWIPTIKRGLALRLSENGFLQPRLSNHIKPPNNIPSSFYFRIETCMLELIKTNK